MKKIFFVLYLVLILLTAFGQTDSLTIQECLITAVHNNPIIRQHRISDEILSNKIKNLNHLWLPDVNFNAQALYNSETVDFSDILNNPQLTLPSLPLDQYKIWADVSQQIYDGGMVRARKEIERAGYQVEIKQTESDLLSIRKQVIQLYFSLLLNQKSAEILNVTFNELTDQMKMVRSGVEHGTVLPENLLAMEAEQITLQQKLSELRVYKKQILKTLSILMDTVLTDHAILTEPRDPGINVEGTRPEFQLFDSQEDLLKGHQKLESANKLPKLLAFSQVAYGRPGYNIVSRDFHAFYTIGASMKWNFPDYGESKRKKKILELQKELITIKTENFRDQLDIMLEGEKGNMEKYDELLKQDMQILELRKAISVASLARLNNGVITSTEYLNHMNSETLAKLQLENHKILKKQAAFNHAVLEGKLSE